MTESEEFEWATTAWLCPQDGMVLILEQFEEYDLRCEDCGLTYRIVNLTHAKRVNDEDDADKDDE